MRFDKILMAAATQPSGGVSYSAEAVALFARMSVAPDATRKGHIDTLIRALKTAGVWTKMDAFYMFAAHDAQAARLNWKTNSYDCSAVNSPTFTTDRGYTGDGATSYLDSGFNPTTAGGLYALNNAHMGGWVGTDVGSTTQLDGGNTNARLCGRGTTTATVRVNCGTVNQPSVATSVGWLCFSRSVSTDFDVVKNLGTPVNQATASTSVTNAPFYMLAVGAAGPTPASFSTRRMQAFHFGGPLNDTERDATYNALSTYMTAVGA